ncbi:MAG: hypothetical protein K8S97_14180 [Anaerolineae bacterium]|nr:hypothetical protein [Anaerolineae bacterium]
MEGVFNFLASRNGRITRAVIGVLILIIGIAIGWQSGSVFGWVLVTYSIFLLLETALNLVLLAPFFGKSLAGDKILSGEQVDDTLAELEVLDADLDEKNLALLHLMRYWLFGTFCIVASAVYSYGFMFTNTGNYVEAFRNTAPILGSVAVLCALTYLGYWWYLTRIKQPRINAAAQAAPAAAPADGE